ncbi:MAG: hypothetical protein GX416_07370 [Bacteroidales bacterium]|nr:hypothetical protein [Bacteroidales bacterium]
MVQDKENKKINTDIFWTGTKKNCYLSQAAIFINLKSNTMKNTVQIYSFYVLKHNKITKK